MTGASVMLARMYAFIINGNVKQTVFTVKNAYQIYIILRIKKYKSSLILNKNNSSSLIVIINKYLRLYFLNCYAKERNL